MFQYSAHPDPLKDRVILVTGAGRDIGAAAAKIFAAHDTTVLPLGKTEEYPNEVHDAIEAVGHLQAAVIPPNLETAQPYQFEELAVILENEFGRIDGLLHNVSVLDPRSPMQQTFGENFMRVTQVNVNAMFMLTTAMPPPMKLSSDASIIFTSSSVGRKGRAYWGAYSVSKLATEDLMQILADELDGINVIRVNSVNPGATRASTRILAYPGENPLNNPTGEEIMSVYLYLMGLDSAGVNGQAFDAQ